MSDGNKSHPLLWGTLFIGTIAAYYFMVDGGHYLSTSENTIQEVSAEAPKAEPKSERMKSMLHSNSKNASVMRQFGSADENAKISEDTITDAENQGFGPVLVPRPDPKSIDETVAPKQAAPAVVKEDTKQIKAVDKSTKVLVKEDNVQVTAPITRQADSVKVPTQNFSSMPTQPAVGNMPPQSRMPAQPQYRQYPNNSAYRQQPQYRPPNYYQQGQPYGYGNPYANPYGAPMNPYGR